MPAGVKTMACSRSDRETMPFTTSALSTRTSRWTWDRQESHMEITFRVSLRSYDFVGKVFELLKDISTSASTIRSMMVSKVSSG